MKFTLSGEPVPCPRPRRAPRGGVYMPKEYVRHVEGVKLQLLAVRPKSWDSSALFSVRAEFSLSNHARGGFDIDNLLKTVLDAGSGILWDDDRQVVEGYVRKYPHCPDEIVGTEVEVEAVA